MLRDDLGGKSRISDAIFTATRNLRDLELNNSMSAGHVRFRGGIAVSQLPAASCGLSGLERLPPIREMIDACVCRRHSTCMAHWKTTARL